MTLNRPDKEQGWGSQRFKLPPSNINTTACTHDPRLNGEGAPSDQEVCLHTRSRKQRGRGNGARLSEGSRGGEGRPRKIWFLFMFPSLAPLHIGSSPTGGKGEGHIPVFWSTFTPTVLGPAWGAPRAHATREDSNKTRPPNMAEFGGLRFQLHFFLGDEQSPNKAHSNSTVDFNCGCVERSGHSCDTWVRCSPQRAPTGTSTRWSHDR